MEARLMVGTHTGANRQRVLEGILYAAMAGLVVALAITAVFGDRVSGLGAHAVAALVVMALLAVYGVAMYILLRIGRGWGNDVRGLKSRLPYGQRPTSGAPPNDVRRKRA
jgi:hypothetical protein